MKRYENIFGTVRCELSGDSPERFLTIAKQHGIAFFNITRESGAIRFEMAARDYGQLLPVAYKTRTKAVILEKRGLPFWLRRNKRRAGIATGILTCIALYIFLSTKIWKIEITGNQYVTRDELFDWLYANNIYSGMFKNDLDGNELENSLLKNFPELKWVGVSVDGLVCKIDLREKIPGKRDELSVDNIIDVQLCGHGGIITGTLIRSGTLMVSPGDTVADGEILIDNKDYYTLDGTTIYRIVTADGDIKIQYYMPVFEQISQKKPVKTIVGKETEYWVKIGKIQWKLRLKPEFRGVSAWQPRSITASVEETPEREINILTENLFGALFGVRRSEYYIIEYEDVEREEAKRILNEKLCRILSTYKQKGVQIIEKDVRIELYEEKYALLGELLLEEVNPTRK